MGGARRKAAVSPGSGGAIHEEGGRGDHFGGVDDAAFMRLRLRQLLEAQGHVVARPPTAVKPSRSTSHTGPTWSSWMSTMPEMDGIAAVQALVARDPNAQRRDGVGLGPAGDGAGGIQAGAKDFIVKPF